MDRSFIDSSASAPNLECEAVPGQALDGSHDSWDFAPCVGYTPYFQSDGELSSSYSCRDGWSCAPKGNLRSSCHIYVMILSTNECEVSKGAYC